MEDEVDGIAESLAECFQRHADATEVQGSDFPPNTSDNGLRDCDECINKKICVNMYEKGYY